MEIRIPLIIGGLCLIFCACKEQQNKTAESNPQWKLGVQSWTFRLFTLQETISKADSAKIRYIEAFWGQPLGEGTTDSFGSTMSAESRAKLKSWLNAKGISIKAMGVITPRTREEWIKAFELAREFQMSYISSEPIKNQWDMIDTLADEYGVKVAIHDHPIPNPYWHPDSVVAAVAGHKNLGACADVGHWARSGLDPVDCLRKLDGHIVGVHLKDIKTFGERLAEDTIVSLGFIDFPGIFRELKRQNFTGMFSIEHESNWMNSLPDVILTREYFEKETAKIQ